MKIKKKYDLIYVGTGPILILDALNETLKGKNVIMVDSSARIGGAWKLLDIHNLKGLENAVHYLMPNKSGYDFLKNYLGIELLKPKKKFYAIKFLNFHTILSTSNILGKLSNNLIKEIRSDNFILERFIKNILKKDSASNAKYPKKGSKEILNKLSNLLKKIEVDILLNTKINEIIINSENVLSINTDNGFINAKKIIISHGFIPSSIQINNKKVKVEKKLFPRPSLHIIYETQKDFSIKKLLKFSQIIFPPDSFIKYIHELTQYINRKEEQQKTYAIVIALKHDLENNIDTHNKVISILEEYNIIPKKEFIKKINFFWQDIFLPLISTEDLNFLEEKSNGIIKGMQTEELNSCIGLHQEKWLNLKRFLENNRNYEK